MKKFALIIASLLLFLASCERRPLVEDSKEVSISVEVNIEAVANVTMGVYNEHIPVPDLNTDMVRVMVYDPKTKNLITQAFLSNKDTGENGEQVLSGDIVITPGTYDFVCYNFDTATTQVRNENNENEIEAYTPGISDALKTRYTSRNKTKTDENTKADPFEGQINYEPDHLVVAREHSYTIAPDAKRVVINTEASTVVDTYYIQIHVKGLEFAANASAILSGMSPSNKFGLNERIKDPSASLYFDLVKSTDDHYATKGSENDVLCAVFNTFGKIEDISSNLDITFNVIDTGGNLQEKTINMDKIFNSQLAKEKHWLLIDEVWEIQDPGNGGGNGGQQTTGGGFNPQVEDWNEENSDIML